MLNIQISSLPTIGMVAQFFAQIRSDPNPSNILSNILYSNSSCNCRIFGAGGCMLFSHVFSNNLWHPTISAPTVPQPVAAKVRGRPQLHSATPTSAAVVTKRQEIDHTHHVKHHVKHHGIFTEYHGESSRAAMSFSSFSFCLSDREGPHP